VLRGYLTLLYRRHGTYEEVACRARLDRWKVKRYLTGSAGDAGG
jgi:hypothetical protein